MTKLMLGNEAIARGIYEAGCRLVFSYPGTPSTEITEAAAGYDEIYAEWAPNEKVALEAAIGASIAGARAFCSMKHVGLNVAADPLFTAVYTGVNGGLVIAVADDPGMHSSQNEQDTRTVALAAKIPVLEASDSEECKFLTVKAFEISEEFDLPVIIRVTTRVAHTRSPVTINQPLQPRVFDYTKDAAKYVMVPANAKNRRISLETRLANIKEYSENSGLNYIEQGSDIGFIASGITRLYVKELHASEQSAILHLRMVNPLPQEMIKAFAKEYDRIVVAEELDPVIEAQCKALGLKVDGK
ncbi:MAG: indolepyruvate ferredoxin oxidoreductase subunit alpha, partial [Oscillospiraceae bacterium]|nr:indolepyruvate ferredoxin oxidoreductase subunit alpha [Oscillospiraceae bacterium]